MSRIVAFRCSSAPYLLVLGESSQPWMTDASVEFLGDVETNSFGASVASAIEFQIATRSFAIISQEHFLFSRPAAPSARHQQNASTPFPEPGKEAVRVFNPGHTGVSVKPN